MQIYTISQARQHLAEVMEIAISGTPVEITHHDGSAAVLISREEFNTFQEAKLDSEFAEIMGRHDRTIKALTNR